MQKSKFNLLIILILPVVVLFLSLCVFIFIWHSGIGNSNDIYGLLNGYHNFYVIILTYFIGFAIAILLVTIISFRYYMNNYKIYDEFVTSVFSYEKKRKEFKRFFLYLMFFPIVIHIIFSVAFINMEDVFDKLSTVKNDISQVKSGELNKAIVYFNNKHYEYKFASGNDNLVVESYSGVIKDGERRWIKFNFPDYLNFTVDENAIYNENKSINWNNENVKPYEITYTDNLNIVVSYKLVE